MILVDTSVWIDHLRSGDRGLAQLLEGGAILGHPWVVGEVALGSLRAREEVLGLLSRLPQATVADDGEVLQLIERDALYSRGIGYVDAQLLASTKLTRDARLWTRDERLLTIAADLELDFKAG